MPLQIMKSQMYQLLRAVNDAALPATPATDPWSQKAKKKHDDSYFIFVGYMSVLGMLLRRMLESK